MKKIFLFIVFLIAVYQTQPVWEKYAKPFSNLAFIELAREQAENVWENPIVIDAVGTVSKEVQSLMDMEPGPVKQIPKPSLSTPDSQTFSVYNAQIGDERAEVEKEIGKPKRRSQNEYGVDWYAYHENYRNFLMVSYDENDQVTGLYTNQDLISSTLGISIDTPKETVRAKLGEPLNKLRKGLTYYILSETDEHDYFQIDNNYVTVFYDIHEKNTVTAIQIIDEDLESRKKTMYAKESPELRTGFEYQLFDVTNAARVTHGLSVLTWDDHAKETAREHSLDMAQNNYFDHTNLQGQSPFDRMEEDGIKFMTAGENLAFGQYSSIFAHEGLMNSAGHRKNILSDDFGFLSVGAAFNEKSQPYYTENFFNN